eukprot:CAMPEP_0178439774 /NCGR_PEP_ID=MMETSP0689_2-20121128/36359_1 /TAXON_ID=160604 /ORGANISM="Amphidinium massartii, Strain CS-259" /LENGTH=786 /DNA_ID=CAMNT_0020062373 /DNA_START=13 /DNA_END=2373 /DNA_ORIENTATION=-
MSSQLANAEVQLEGLFELRKALDEDQVGGEQILAAVVAARREHADHDTIRRATLGVIRRILQKADRKMWAAHKVTPPDVAVKVTGGKMVFAVMRAFSEDLEIQREAASTLTTRLDGHHAFADALTDEGLLELLMDATRKLGYIESVWDVLFTMIAGCTPHMKAAMTDAGVHLELIKLLGEEPSERLVHQGAGLLANLAGGSQEVKRELIDAGAALSLVNMAEQHAGNVFLLCYGCQGLSCMCDVPTAMREGLVHEGRTLEFASKALEGGSMIRVGNAFAVTFLSSMAELPSVRHLLVEQGAHRVLLDAGVNHDYLFGPASVGVAYISAEQFIKPSQSDESREVNPTAEKQLLQAAESRRFSRISALKDAVLPVVDVSFDVANLVDFIRRDHPYWALALLSGILFNGAASASLAHGEGRPCLAIFNFLTMGTAGQILGAYESCRRTTKTSLLLGQKMVEGAESMISLLISGDAIAVAGSLPGYPDLHGASAALKWGSLLLSLCCLSVLAVDLDKQAIHDREDLAHLRPIAFGSIKAKTQLLCFHASEVLAVLVVLPLASATRPHGIFVFAAVALMAAFGVGLRASAGWPGTWIVAADDAGKGTRVNINSGRLFVEGCSFNIRFYGATAVVDTNGRNFAMALAPAGDSMLWAQGHYISDAATNAGFSWADGRLLVREETWRLYEAGWSGSGCCSGLARRTVAFFINGPTCFALNVLPFLPGAVMLRLALLRLFLLTGAWATVGIRLFMDEDVKDELTTTNVLILIGAAATGYFLHSSVQGAWHSGSSL